MIRVLVCENLSPKGLSILSQEKDFEMDVEKGLTPERLLEIIPHYDAMTIRSETKVTAAVLERAEKLKLIIRAGIGVDNIDVKAATQRGVVVMNAPSGNIITTAEHTISMLLSLCRHIPQATASLKKGEWAKKRFTGIEVFGKTLGIIGLGNVGRVVADRALGLHMRVIAYDPFISPEAAGKMSVTLVTLDELLSQADFVTIHVPLTPQTKNLIHKETISRMKKGALLVQCARGGIVNENDLYEALKEGRLSGAALDVFEKEPPGAHPLFTLDRFICTPHLGAATDEAQMKVGIETAEQLIDFFKHGVVRNAVNLPAMTPELKEVLRPYLELSKKLGAFQAQLLGSGHLRAIEIEYAGEIVSHPLTPLTHAVVSGFLSEHLEKSVNQVNALLIAQQRGIDIKTTTSSQSHEFTNLISVTVHSGSSSSALSSSANAEDPFKISGTVFNQNEPRVVQIGKFRLEAHPEGNILYVRNWDKPGVIGHLGTVLGRNQINISQLQLSLDKESGEALVLINIDSPASADILPELLALPPVIEVRQLAL